MTNNTPIKRRIRVADIATHVGVSTATVDRVLNDRPNVREVTRQRVLQAKASLEAGTPATPASKPRRLKVILPSDAGPPTEYLARCIQQIGEQGPWTIECEFIRKMEPVQLARKLRACIDNRIDCVAIQALDDTRVHRAIDDLQAAGIPCLGLLSGMDDGVMSGYVGLNNRAAGRTAGLLMGRFTHTPGAILVITGSALYRAHENREMGFRAVLREHFKHIDIVASLTGHDDPKETLQVVSKALTEYPDLVGIYNVGGGNSGVVKALREASVEYELVLIGHNLTSQTHTYLTDGVMDAVVHLNPKQAARKIVDAMLQSLDGASNINIRLPVEIVTRENIGDTDFN